MRGTPFWLPVVAIALSAASTHAAPAADLVIAWAPGRDVAPVAAAARAAGAAFVDQSPAPRRADQAGPQLASALARGIEAYDALRFDDAWTALEEARSLADRTGAVGLSAAQLSDLFLYRGLVRLQREDATAAWDELVTALVVAPTRAFDPARFPPRVLGEIERARTAVVARTAVELTVVAPADCAVTIDGGAQAHGAVTVLPGPHWARATCTAHEPWSARVEVASALRLDAKGVALARPTDSDILVQAGAVDARAVLVVAVDGGVAILRVVGRDGRERDRRTVNVGASLDGVGAAVRELLAPEAEVRRWYRSPWVWAAGAAVIAAAIAIPLTAALVGDDDPDVSVLPPGAWP